MIIADEVVAFAEELQRPPFLLDTDIEVFPSGAAMLDIKIDGVWYVLAYAPTWGCFGFDELDWNPGIGTDFRHSFPTLDTARQHILAMISVPVPAPLT